MNGGFGHSDAERLLFEDIDRLFGELFGSTGSYVIVVVNHASLRISFHFPATLSRGELVALQHQVTEFLVKHADEFVVNMFDNILVGIKDGKTTLHFYSHTPWKNAPELERSVLHLALMLDEITGSRFMIELPRALAV